MLSDVLIEILVRMQMAILIHKRYHFSQFTAKSGSIVHQARRNVEVLRTDRLPRARVSQTGPFLRWVADYADTMKIHWIRDNMLSAISFGIHDIVRRQDLFSILYGAQYNKPQEFVVENCVRIR